MRCYLEVISGLLMLVGQAQGASPSPAVPTRISRAIFEQPISARVNLEPTSVQWNENSSENEDSENASEGAVIAAMGDHVGCAEFPKLAPLKLCFKVQGDVSSLTLNADQMWIQGSTQQPRFVSATKNTSGFSVQFQQENGILNVQIKQNESHV
jgi:hypothetical protein